MPCDTHSGTDVAGATCAAGARGINPKSIHQSLILPPSVEQGHFPPSQHFSPSHAEQATTRVLASHKGILHRREEVVAWQIIPLDNLPHQYTKQMTLLNGKQSVCVLGGGGFRQGQSPEQIATVYVTH
uniref:Uncharacterized protein n=1 Tax=Eutreptiella gymnastica TaxID=73025 RepID=A0A7S4FYG0_9EUGL